MMQLSTIALAAETQTPAMGAIGTSGGRLLSAYDPLFREGDEVTGFYEVLSGAVRAYKIFPDGRRQIVAFAFAGDIVGFGHGDTYRFDCDALTTTRVRMIPKSSLLRAMRAVANGESLFGPQIATRLMQFFAKLELVSQPDIFPELTEREREILSLIADGQTNAEIAEKLVISLKTVRNHVSNIFSKLQVADRAQAAIRAREAGLGGAASTSSGGIFKEE